MTRLAITAHRPAHLRLSVLAMSLGAAICGITGSASSLAAVAEVPLQWPLGHERSAQLTPLGERMQALRVPHPAPPGRGASVRVVTTCADDGSAGSLRELVAASISGDTIDMTGLTC